MAQKTGVRTAVHGFLALLRSGTVMVNARIIDGTVQVDRPHSYLAYCTIIRGGLRFAPELDTVGIGGNVPIAFAE